MAKKSAQKSAGMGKKARKTSNGSQRKEKDTSFSSMQSELMSKTLELIQLKDIIGQAFKHLQGLTRELDRADHKLTVKEVMKLLQVDGPKKRDWEVFHSQLRMFNEPFMEALCKKFPMLSHQEIRIATLLKAGMTTKEIAELFAIQVRTVENHRFSIRKKMRISTERDLVSVLQNLA
ncbi:MAG: LuxR family transcriptional regulator [Bacteroidetes bacterium]|nr:LuxR family transcriptional regulator [bacterium]NBP65225.1 LuxR family transcriptional regulator [Bacteroidota bacterium]